MKTVCILGAGSIGGFVGARLARGGAQVTFLARGATLAALRERGLTLVERGAGRTAPVTAFERAEDAGAHDVVVLAVKSHQLAGALRGFEALLHAETMVVPMQNGIPFWYFQRHGGAHEGRRIQAVDPDAAVLAAIEARRIIGCVVYPACEIVTPGVIRHVEGERFPLGELDGIPSARVRALSALFEAGGLKAPVLADIRNELWLKLWGNLAFNPISALTRATLERICAEAATRDLAAQMMREAQAVAEALGIRFRLPLERRIEGAERVGAHKTSMLQDVEAGRETEIEALVGAVIELARLTGTPVPSLQALHACVKLLSAGPGLERRAA
jgi:2-dehydropantoate 2-reductase